MDIKAYIESGKLEAYAMGMSPADEAREVERMCKAHPELQQELDAIRASLEQYARAHSTQPSAALKARIQEAVQQSTPTQAPASPVQLLVIRSNFRIAAVAASLLLAASLVFNLYLYRKWNAAETELVALNQEKTRLAEEFSNNKVRLETASRDMAIMSDPNTTKVMMKGVAASPNSMAMIYWNKATKQVFLEIKQMPMPEPGKQYQLWAIVDGKPVDAGMITLSEGDTSLHPMRDFESAQAFAITLEKAGGSPTPTLSAIYVMGAVSL